MASNDKPQTIADIANAAADAYKRASPHAPIDTTELPFKTKGASILNAYGVQLAVCRIEDEATAICALINAGHAFLKQSTVLHSETATEQAVRHSRARVAIIQAQEYLRIAADLV